ncbi:hypothetical protein BC941DRAFT_476372 [Chlamydoabsidia padenii]|nr:hypothetical protein BC941DRAFT_476372 [Chlamydoabsidia padenii]
MVCLPGNGDAGTHISILEIRVTTAFYVGGTYRQSGIGCLLSRLKGLEESQGIFILFGLTSFTLIANLDKGAIYRPVKWILVSIILNLVLLSYLITVALIVVNSNRIYAFLQQKQDSVTFFRWQIQA